MEFAIVVLNYNTVNETKEFLESAQKNFPGIRIFVIDNGSAKEKQERLREYVSRYNSVTLEMLPNNVGFAKGFNYGIQKAREEGYNFIAASNNDVLFNDKNLFHRLLDAYKKTSCAVIGPRICTLDGREQNPFAFSRPSAKEARKIYLHYFLWGLAKLPLKKVLPVKFVNWWRARRNRNGNKNVDINPCTFLVEVYALHGAFLVFCPPFFEHYDGFFDGTFLYGEERILAEMLRCKNLRSVYDKRVSVLHKEDRTCTETFGGQEKLGAFLHARKSTIIWYREFYLKA